MSGLERAMENKKNIVIVAHKFLTQPDDELVNFLNREKFENVLHIRHSFSDAKDRCSYYTWYKKGQIHKEQRTKDYKNVFEPFLYAKEIFFTLKWIAFSSVKWDVYIGMDGLCVLFGNILRFFGKIQKTIFWAIDFVPESRFQEGIKNKIYHRINIWGYKNSDEMWDLSPRMVEAREKFLGIKKDDYRKHKVIPYGMWTQEIRTYSFDECEKNTLVFMGHLLEKQGAQLVIMAISEIIKTIPDFRFKIIGDGKYKNELISLAKEKKVSKYCNFMGKIDDIRKLEDEVAKSAIAIAPYIKKLDTWTYYADPGKVKTYIACGVPLLFTDVSWNAREIQEKGCGYVISEDIQEITDKVVEFLKKDINQQCREKCHEYAKSFDYENIFNNLLL
ncbi:MAG: glycosyltransferase [Candidatus Moraniibacteriota bacterium]|nr:MAG: glycosyltransferase [Candidatus Moranbacteria bacterium]